MRRCSKRLRQQFIDCNRSLHLHLGSVFLYLRTICTCNTWHFCLHCLRIVPLGLWSLPMHSFTLFLRCSKKDTDYVLPATNALSSRSARLAALRELCSVAASSYKSLKKQQNMMKSLFGATQRSSNPTYAYTPNLPPTEQVSSEHLGTPPPAHPTYAYNSKSPAEQVLEEHLGKPPPSTPDGMTLVQVNNQTHIFNTLENYTSKWPLGFQGCYRCGSIATKQGCTPRERYPAFTSCSLSDFFKELHTHKPNLR
jgi:hypothetical protein